MRADQARQTSSKTTADNDPALLLIIKLLEGHNLTDLFERAMSLRNKPDLAAIAQKAPSPSQAAKMSASSGRKNQTTVHKAAKLRRDGNEIGRKINVSGLGDILLQIAVTNGCGGLPFDDGA